MPASAAPAQPPPTLQKAKRKCRHSPRDQTRHSARASAVAAEMAIGSGCAAAAAEMAAEREPIARPNLHATSGRHMLPRTPVFRFSRASLSRRRFKQRLRHVAYICLYELQPCTAEQIEQLYRLDCRLTRQLIWDSRHVSAFGPQMGMSLAARLLRAFKFKLHLELERFLGARRMTQPS